MKDNFKNLQELIIAFQDENVCRQYLAERRWKNGTPICPYCNHEHAYTIENGKRYKCKNKECHKKYSVTVGTILEDSNIPLSKWFIAIYIATAHKKGISSLQLGRDISVTQKTAWFMLHRIRELVRQKSFEQMTGIVEADETFVGGKNKNRHAHKKVKQSQGRSVKDKTPVFGLIQRDGKLKTQVIPDTKAETLKPIIKEMVNNGTIIITDEWGSYNGLSTNYTHEVIKHNDNEFVRGDFHTNSIEGFWSLLKRGIYGIYHYASPKHLHRYCDEFEYRYNTRKTTDVNRFAASLNNINGRLTYNQLIANQ